MGGLHCSNACIKPIVCCEINVRMYCNYVVDIACPLKADEIELEEQRDQEKQEKKKKLNQLRRNHRKERKIKRECTCSRLLG